MERKSSAVKPGGLTKSVVRVSFMAMPIKVEDGTKSKYVLIYAKDVTIPPNPQNSGTASFLTMSRLAWFLVWNQTARKAIRAHRFQLIRVGKADI